MSLLALGKNITSEIVVVALLNLSNHSIGTQCGSRYSNLTSKNIVVRLSKRLIKWELAHLCFFSRVIYLLYLHSIKKRINPIQLYQTLFYLTSKLANCLAFSCPKAINLRSADPTMAHRFRSSINGALWSIIFKQTGGAGLSECLGIPHIKGTIAGGGVILRRSPSRPSH